MTAGEAAAQIEAQLGPMWPRDRSVPKEMLAPLCEALWQEGAPRKRRRMGPLFSESARDSPTS